MCDDWRDSQHKELDQVRSILPALELLPLTRHVEGEQLNADIMDQTWSNEESEKNTRIAVTRRSFCIAYKYNLY